MWKLYHPLLLNCRLRIDEGSSGAALYLGTISIFITMALVMVCHIYYERSYLSQYNYVKNNYDRPKMKKITNLKCVFFTFNFWTWIIQLLFK